MMNNKATRASVRKNDESDKPSKGSVTRHISSWTVRGFKPSKDPSHYSRPRGYFSGLLLAVGLAATAQADQRNTYYIPFSEQHVLKVLDHIDAYRGNLGMVFKSTVTFACTSEDTIIVVDHWEDGYEADPSSPVQNTTEVWGDGNTENGIAPGTFNDRLAKQELVINEVLPVPRVSSEIRLDAGDRISATRPIVLSRTLYPLSVGTDLAGGGTVQPYIDWGTEFVAPVGPETEQNDVWEVTTMLVMAGDRGAEVLVDRDSNGQFETRKYLEPGQSYLFRGMSEGARMQSSEPVQAHLLTGDAGSSYEMRWVALLPSTQWGTHYEASSNVQDGGASRVYLHNPGDKTIKVSAVLGGERNVLKIAAHATVKVDLIHAEEGFIVSKKGQPFVAVRAFDVFGDASANQVHDYACSLVPSGRLTPESAPHVEEIIQTSANPTQPMVPEVAIRPATPTSGASSSSAAVQEEVSKNEPAWYDSGLQRIVLEIAQTECPTQNMVFRADTATHHGWYAASPAELEWEVPLVRDQFGSRRGHSRSPKRNLYPDTAAVEKPCRAESPYRWRRFA